LQTLLRCCHTAPPSARSDSCCCLHSSRGWQQHPSQHTQYGAGGVPDCCHCCCYCTVSTAATAAAVACRVAQAPLTTHPVLVRTCVGVCLTAATAAATVSTAVTAAAAACRVAQAPLTTHPVWCVPVLVVCLTAATAAAAATVSTAATAAAVACCVAAAPSQHTQYGAYLCWCVPDCCAAALFNITCCGVVQQVVHGLISRYEGRRNPAAAAAAAAGSSSSSRQQQQEAAAGGSSRRQQPVYDSATTLANAFNPGWLPVYAQCLKVDLTPAALNSTPASLSSAVVCLYAGSLVARCGVPLRPLTVLYAVELHPLPALFASPLSLGTFAQQNPFHVPPLSIPPSLTL